MKLKLVSIAVSAALFCGSAFAIDLDPKAYVGVEGQVNQVNLKKNKGAAKTAKKDDKHLKQNLGATVFAGTRICENFGVEAGFTEFNRKKQKFTMVNKVTGSKKIRTNNTYVDAMGYLPVTECVDVIGSVGAGYMHSKVTTTGAKSHSSGKIGPRFGVGTQVKFTENLGARLMLRHQQGNKIIKNVNSAAAGLFYQF